jgi:uncharacterized repeat protein (TIGR03803 family)
MPLVRLVRFVQEPCTWKKANFVFLLCITTAIASPGQTFNALATFNLGNGASPEHMALVQGHDGNFYGTTYYGGANPYGGTVFRIAPGGALSTMHNFCRDGDNCADGNGPLGGLLLATDGNFYGTTEQGSNAICPYGCGTVFKITPGSSLTATTPGGKLTPLYSFDYTEGAYPVGTLIQANNGNFYGTTYSWGTKGSGTVFQITPTGVLTTLHNFAGLPNDGANPDAGLVQSADGNFYGTTPFGGSGTSCDAGCGTIFRIAQDGKLTILHNFNYADGAEPIGGLVLATDGNFYGTTASGANGFGTFFRITPVGKLTTLYSFCAQTDCIDGGIPVGALVQATDGNFYGTTAFVGPINTCRWTPTYILSACGTIFRMTPDGTLTTLHTLSFSDGAYPAGGLLQATSGIFYGTTFSGGEPNCLLDGCGTIFSLDVGLGPFVSLERYSGRVGETGGILGQGFTGTTSVSLNGTSASFTVESDTFIEATVPTGATTGYVTVTTPTGTLTSNVPFYVIP